MNNEVKFKIGQIEFEAKGDADIIERERREFVNTLLPLAIEAMVRTNNTQSIAYFSTESEEKQITSNELPKLDSASHIGTDLSRTSLASFISDRKVFADQDFVTFAAYYDEKKNNINEFSSEDVKKYYAEARKPEYSNVSELLRQLVKKGYIMDSPSSPKTTPKKYTLTDNGIKYVETYEAKEETKIKKGGATKPKNAKTKVESIYSHISADDLNLKNYPEIKSQDSFKKQMLLTLYIVANEGHGDSFLVADVQYIMTDVLGLPASEAQIKGIFAKNKSWFKSDVDSNNKKAYKRKLLEGAKDFAKSLL